VIESPSTGQWHVVQVAEIWLHPPAVLTGQRTSSGDDDDGGDEVPTTAGANGDVVVGSHGGINLSRRRRTKLKGRGVLPEFPTLRTYSVRTTGCQMNVADSERLAGILEGELSLSSAGDEALGAKEDDADLIIWNTCSIRDRAEKKLYDAVGPFAARKRKGERVALIVTGCVAQQEGLALLKRIPEIDAVVGPQYVPFLKNIVETIAAGNQVVATAPMLIQEDVGTAGSGGSAVLGIDGDGTDRNFYSKPVRGHDVRAWVNVIYGCNEHCTYCVVPSTRGMEQSRSMEAILGECLDLANRGYREITLIGQNIDAYGR